jgi:hypothetical protein
MNTQMKVVRQLNSCQNKLSRQNNTTPLEKVYFDNYLVVRQLSFVHSFIFQFFITSRATCILNELFIDCPF